MYHTNVYTVFYIFGMQTEPCDVRTREANVLNYIHICSVIARSLEFMNE